MHEKLISSAGGTTSERDRIRKSLELQRKFRGDLVAYVVINAFLVVVWLLTGAGYFWPVWVMAAWGVLLVLDGWNAYLRRPVTEEDIDRHVGSGRT